MPLCHTEHMSHLLLFGDLYDSMPFETMAEVMTAHGLDTTHGQAMDAYDDCTRLGYPRGGTPKAWDLTYDGGTLDFPSIEEMFYCECNNDIPSEDHARDGGLCEDCREVNETIEMRNSGLVEHTGRQSNDPDECKCGRDSRNTRMICAGCAGPLCYSCAPQTPLPGHRRYWRYHWDCMPPHLKGRFKRM